MKLFFVLWSAVLLFQVSFAQKGFFNKTEAKNTKVKGLKEGYWIEYVDSTTFFSEGFTTKEKGHWYSLCEYKKGKPYGPWRVYLMDDKLIFEGECSSFPLLDTPGDSVKNYNGICKWYGTYLSRYSDTQPFPIIEASFTNGKRTGVSWYESGQFYSQGTILHHAYYGNGKIKEETNCVNDTIAGLQKEFYPDGSLKATTPYSLGKIEGIVTTFDSLGLKISETEYLRGQALGQKRFQYYKSGKLWLENHYQMNFDMYDWVLNGVTEYYESGKMKMALAYSNGIRTGLTQEFYESARLKMDALYENGKPKGSEKIYFENGNVRIENPFTTYREENGFLYEEFYFEDGDAAVSFSADSARRVENRFRDDESDPDRDYLKIPRDGTFREYFESGKKKYELAYVKGKRSGVWKSWFENGMLWQSVTYKDGLKSGEETENYESGSRKRVSVFLNGKKNGKEIFYDEKGVIVKTLVYKNGVGTGN
jgi:antitoxin component YwqK of YwqJK toxin-antitoxin module